MHSNQCLSPTIGPPVWFCAPDIDHKTVTNRPSNSNSGSVHDAFTSKPYTLLAVFAVSRATSVAGRSTISASARTV